MYDLNKFKEILSIPSCSNMEKEMFVYIYKKLKNIKGVKVEIKNKNIIATKGESKLFPGICCHIDTVHKIVSKKIEIKQKGNIITSKHGIGGDDKCEIFACLELLNQCKNIKTYFFSNEEIGMVGSSNLDEKEFNNLRYLIELDRKVKDDLICYHYGKSLISEDFKKDIEDIKLKYNYKDEEGLGTDVSTLVENGLNLSVINVSCGYYNPHTLNEYINIKHVYNCIDFVKEIIKNLPEKKYINNYEHNKHNMYNYTNIHNDQKCVLCGFYEEKGFSSEDGFICEYCLNEMVSNKIRNY